MRRKAAPRLPEEIREIWQRGGDVMTRRRRNKRRNKGERGGGREGEMRDKEDRLGQKIAVIGMQTDFSQFSQK